MEHDLTTRTWQENISCPIKIILLCTSDVWILTLVYMQFTGDYWLRHMCPDYTADFAQGLDKSICKIFQMCIGIDINSWTDFVKERM